MKQEQTPQKLSLGIVICLFAYVFFVMASSAVWTIDLNFPVIEIVFFQNLVSFIVLCFTLPVKYYPGLLTRNVSLHLVRDITGVLSYYLFFLAIGYLNLVDATLLNYTAPFFVPVIWWAWMKESVAKNVWWSIVIGFIGVCIILNPSKQIFELGFVLGLFAGICSAIAFCGIRVLTLHKEPARRTLFYYFLTGIILTFPFTVIYWQMPTAEMFAKLIWIGACTCIGQLLLTIAYRYGTASYLSPLGYVSVVFAGISMYFFFGKQISINTWIGSIFIVLGGSLTYLSQKRPKSIKQTFETPNPKEKPPL